MGTLVAEPCGILCKAWLYVTVRYPYRTRTVIPILERVLGREREAKAVREREKGICVGDPGRERV